MKLPDFGKWADLTDLCVRMGVTRLGDLRLSLDPNRLTQAELENLTSGGVDIASLEDLRVLPDGTLAYKDSRVLLYIRDVANYRGESRGKVVDLPRFHLANCDTLQRMRRDKRFERYVVAARQDGLFEVNIVENNRVTRSSPEPLKVCQNCLGHLRFNGFEMNMTRPARHAAVAAFKLSGFFSAYPRALILENPPHQSDSAPLNVYPDDFDELAIQTKTQRGWRCEGIGCRIDLQAGPLRKHLHLHHINGLKYDSRHDNLKVLCTSCHASQPNHSHMKDLPEYREFERMRHELLSSVRSEVLVENVGAEHRPTAFTEAAFLSFARAHRLTPRDLRPRGALWVEMDKAPPHVSAALKNWGFKFKEGRGWWRV